MSEYMLHIAGATRMSDSSAIAGDRAALLSLRRAVDDALRTGSGGASLFSSDGEPHAVALVLVENMDPVYTSYADDKDPVRSRRETVPILQLPNYLAALRKAGDLQTAYPRQTQTRSLTVLPGQVGNTEPKRRAT